MCLACEQQAMWLAYMRRRGLVALDDSFIVEPPVEPAPAEPGADEQDTAANTVKVTPSGDRKAG
jgi:hypothetical protein